MSSLRKSTCVAASVNVPLIYRLDMPAQETLPYAAAIAKMAELPHRRSPSAKIAVVSNVCHLIDDAVQRYYAIHPNPPPMDKLHIAADDLVSVLAYVLVVSDCPHLASHLALMDAFLPDRISAGEEAYSLTMLHTAVAHLRSSSVDSKN
ncbi:hypothetical protein AaE_008039 [Aphanomyces astaci]|uniref:VPS9 domain-containing protein n=1 Tax=Aphanomyces astaci TaxID=112090 RepID=A0A6A5AGB5_APHAT|nr:hypothetical protein AaE_008039 [Aphanomyces astaci]